MKSKRQRLLEGMRRTLSDLLEERAGALARARGWRRTPATTSSIYRLCASGAPDLIDQLFQVHEMTRHEQSHARGPLAVPPPVTDTQRKQMLSAVRAAVSRTSVRGRSC